jgi:hypothetical protein
VVRAQKPVSCRLLGFPGANPPTVSFKAADGARVTREVPSGTLSEPLQCLAEQGAVRFYQPGGEPAAAEHLLASAKVPDAVRAAILVFIPAGENANPPWRVVVFEDSAQRFPDGGALVANFHPADIRCLIGEHRVDLAPGQSEPVARPARRDDFNMAPAIFQFQHERQWRTASESMLRFTPGQRYLLVCHADPASGRPRVFTCVVGAPPVVVEDRK